jgi:putative flippase GtrA
VDLSPGALLAWSRSEEGRKAMKYTAVSVISTIVSQIAFILVYGVFSWFGPRGSSIFATCVGAVPSYYLNRRWAWGKTGRSHMMKEVVPFWALALVGLVYSTWAVDFTHSHISGVTSHFLHTVCLAAAYLGSFGSLWIVKFLIFNRFMFVDHHRHHHREPEPVG